MRKKINLSLLITTLLCLIPMILSAVLYDKLPDTIPSHFNFNGEADGYSHKAIICYVMPALLAAGNIFLHLVIRTDPKNKNISKGLISVMYWFLPLLSVTLVPLNLFKAMNENIQIQVIVPLLISILFIACGNYLPKTRQNYTVGIKIPWTLDNEDNWNKTHRLAGFLWVLSGFSVLLAGIFQFHPFAVMMVSISVMVLIPSVYSYILYRNSK